MRRSLLDTDTLSEIMKSRDAAVSRKACEYLIQFGAFTFSLITRYEILRGLKAKNAVVQTAAFDKRCQESQVLPLTDAVVVRAADLYAYLRTRGQLISDADLLVAATALIHNLVLVTNNIDHFGRVPGLQLDRWTES